MIAARPSGLPFWVARAAGSRGLGATPLEALAAAVLLAIGRRRFVQSGSTMEARPA